MTDSAGFAKLVPGFDFLQSLAKSTGALIPGMGQWVAPTLDPTELEKRIEELRTVQFWLEQNARLLGTTIQALEVQRMTLSTLKTMNVQMDSVRESLKMPTPDASQEHLEHQERVSTDKSTNAVDPMQWWKALTQQFTEIATTAIKDTEKAAKAVHQANAAAATTSAASSTKPAATKSTRQPPPSANKAVRRKPDTRP